MQIVAFVFLNRQKRMFIVLAGHLLDKVFFFAFCFRYLPIGVLFLITDSVLGVKDWRIALKILKFAGVVCMAYVHFVCFNFVA